MAATRPVSAAKTVGVRELRQNLSRYLERVKAGETLTVTEHGHEVARLMPSHPDVHTGYLDLAEKYGATIPKGDLVETVKRLRTEGRLGSGMAAGTTDAILAEGRRERI
jgi:prevent-host-death family protein